MKKFIQQKPIWLTILMITLASSILGFMLVPYVLNSPGGTFFQVTLSVVIPSFLISLFVSTPVVYFYKKIIKENQQLILNLQKDFLTGLLNRHTFYEQYNRLIESTRLNQTPIALIMVDIDNFKKINDTFGHIAGDYVIQYSANQIQELLHESDLICRFGGEEFLIVLVNISFLQAKESATNILKSMDSLLNYNNQQIKFTASIGLVYSDKVTDSLELIHQADKFMYQAKAQGKNQLVY